MSFRFSAYLWGLLFTGLIPCNWGILRLKPSLIGVNWVGSSKISWSWFSNSEINTDVDVSGMGCYYAIRVHHLDRLVPWLCAHLSKLFYPLLISNRFYTALGRSLRTCLLSATVNSIDNMLKFQIMSHSVTSRSIPKTVSQQIKGISIVCRKVLCCRTQSLFLKALFFILLPSATVTCKEFSSFIWHPNFLATLYFHYQGVCVIFLFFLFFIFFTVSTSNPHCSKTCNSSKGINRSVWFSIFSHR